MLGMLIDRELRFKKYIAKAATKGLCAAAALKRLRMLSPTTARQLFGATVAPVVDYASPIWMHARGTKETAAMEKVQRIGAQAVVGAFKIISRIIAESEASLKPVEERHREKAIKMWFNKKTLPVSNPIKKLEIKNFRRFVSPLQKLAKMMEAGETGDIETIAPYTIAPWQQRISVEMIKEDEAEKRLAEIQGIVATTSASSRGGRVGIGGVIQVTGRPPEDQVTFGETLETDKEQNVVIAELLVIGKALKILILAAACWHKVITIVINNLAAAQAIAKPRQQSGQRILAQIYGAVRILWGQNNTIRV